MTWMKKLFGDNKTSTPYMSSSASGESGAVIKEP
jgi:hypothetical protein